MTDTSPTRLIGESVEYSLTQHCNIRCVACDHASPLLAESYAELQNFSRDLEALATVFHAKELRLVGGEPLLHPGLLAFVTEAKRIGIADQVVLYTNGVLLHKMHEDVWRAIDGLHVSAYPGVRRRLSDKQCAERCRIHGVALSIDHYETFAHTLLGKRIVDRKLVKAIYRACRATECHTVHDGRFYKCPVASIMKPWLALRGIDFASPASDGVALHDNPTLRPDLERYLASATPLAACDYCLGTSGRMIPHRQLDRSGCRAWLNEDSQPEIDDVRGRLLRQHVGRLTMQKLRSLLKA